MPKRRKYIQRCERCNSVVVMKNGKYPKRFCSKECSHKFLVGKNHACFKDGKHEHDGYIHVLVEGSGKYILEHRLVMEKYIGRKLGRFENVHHLDRNKRNNNIENLILMSVSEHSRMHYENGESGLNK